jgi:hypothetical protein
MIAKWRLFQLEELSDIALDFEIGATGFEPPEIDLRIQSLEPPDESTNAADEFEPSEGPAVSRQGDLWTLGSHRLLCGNALDSHAYGALLAGEKAAAVFTDPPYNVRVEGHVSGKGARKHREFPMAAGELTEDEFCRFLSEAFGLMASHSVDGATLFACMDWRHLLEIVGAIRALGCELLNLCVWVKTNGGLGSLYRSRHELVFVFGKRDATRVNNVQLGKHGRNRTNVWNYPGMNSFARRGRTRGLDVHPTVKPIAMVSDAIPRCYAARRHRSRSLLRQRHDHPRRRKNRTAWLRDRARSRPCGYRHRPLAADDEADRHSYKRQDLRRSQGRPPMRR